MTYRKPPFLLRKWQRLQMRYYAYRNPEKLVRIRYRQRFGTDPDLENPRTFNEKVLWMMLHADTTRWSQLADKYRVREYVEQCGLGWMLNELYGVWESAEEIDFSGGGISPTPATHKLSSSTTGKTPISGRSAVHSTTPCERNSAA